MLNSKKQLILVSVSATILLILLFICTISLAHMRELPFGSPQWSAALQTNILSFSAFFVFTLSCAVIFLIKNLRKDFSKK